ncbi:competence lipoprotein ComL, putative [Parvularcula bermudensis HTCC2503]|uniref:Outer membrane protein assembly factor BamD n=1 Tax=Parvularcula bermudensis (strain ATCC BAA-594 / HTCC2503 / KCTC 12087) TaxID=314260 RepID=E0TG19_PARBH|nr:outer membrane protein assembly factor BamD [Parvularcula bermudensis]ADM10138.1 competence lipoprotein ComL, putative [Parvularcula bermudensis HTCC2503]
MSGKIALTALGSVLLALGGCSNFGNAPDDRLAYVEEPVEILYRKAADALERRRYEEAVLLFEEVERQHPYSSWARRAMLMVAYSEYLQNNYDASIASIDRFLAVHPGNKDAAYAYYLRAINYYERIRDVGRDQDITAQALSALEDVIRRYPDSDYARDASLKLDLTRDHLAGKEMDIGRWYLKRNEHIAAINRFNEVLTTYETTSHVPEALHRLVEAYLEMGVAFEAQRHAAILAHNYPDSNWYRDSYRMLDRRGLTDTTALNSWVAPTAAEPALTATASSASPPDGRLGARTAASEALLGAITEADQ